MKTFRALFTVVKEKNCPLYEMGELFQLSATTFAGPSNKEACLILVRDMTELLFRILQKQPVSLEDYDDQVFNCSGCRGLIKFSLLPRDDPRYATVRKTHFEAEAGETRQKSLFDSPIFRGLPADQLDYILIHFQEMQLKPGTVLIRKGEKNRHLYLVCSGELVVEDGGHLATIKTGELCGELSYFGADVANATVRANRESVVLVITGEAFGRLFGNNPMVQTFMAQLLADRLRQTNAARARDLDSCMNGRIDEIVPAELFQIFHMHQKTGVLSMELSQGTGKISFREGCIINASYGQWRNEDAIFKILAEKKGHYRFITGLLPQEMKAAEIGDFMSLLMEGVKRVDEEKGN